MQCSRKIYIYTHLLSSRMGQVHASLYDEVNIVSGKAKGIWESTYLHGATRDVAWQKMKGGEFSGARWV